jgi:1-phosphofructokinase
VDAEGSLLMDVLKYAPFLVKPNHHELGGIFGKRLSGAGEIGEYALKLKELGAQNVLVSMEDKVALLACAGGCFHFPSPAGKLVNSTGAGDSMVAGFLAGLLETDDMEYALKMGLAAGSASAFSMGLAAKAEIISLFGNI